jgi:hypothetical protein
MVILQVCSYLVWLPLEILALIAILRGGVSRHPFVFAYLITSFLTAVLEMPISFAYLQKSGSQKLGFEVLYWVDEGVREVLIFAVVINLIYRTTANLESRRIARLLLLAGSVLFVAISFLVHYDSTVFMGHWITPWTRDLKFCSAVLDLALWALLISSRKKDQTLLMLTGGMGIMFAGEAIGESIRSIAIPQSSHALVKVGSVVGLLADFAFLYIWWQALRRESRPQDGSRRLSYSGGIR